MRRTTQGVDYGVRSAKNGYFHVFDSEGFNSGTVQDELKKFYIQKKYTEEEAREKAKKRTQHATLKVVNLLNEVCDIFVLIIGCN